MKKTLLGGALGVVTTVAMDGWEEGKHPRGAGGKFGAGSGGQKKEESEPAKLVGPVSGRGRTSLNEGAIESAKQGQPKERFLANLKDKGYHEAHVKMADKIHDHISAHYAAGKKAAEAGHNVEQARAYARSKIPHTDPHAQRAFIEGHGEKHSELQRDPKAMAERLVDSGMRRDAMARHFFNNGVGENDQAAAIEHAMKLRAERAKEDGHSRRQLLMNLQSQGFSEAEQKRAGHHFDGGRSEPQRAAPAKKPTRHQLSFAQSVGHYAKSEADIEAQLAKEGMDHPDIRAHAVAAFKANQAGKPKSRAGLRPGESHGKGPAGDPMITHKGNPVHLD